MTIKIPKRGHETSSSAQTVASLDDLLMEILLRLPIKSLIQFKLVSKQWHSLISAPQFCLRRSPNPNPAIGLFLPRSDGWANRKYEYVPFSAKMATSPPFTKLSFTEDPSGISIMQSCNGLMLCSSFRAYNNAQRYYVYNPTINRFSTLPKIEGGPRISSIVYGMNLAFEPTKSPHYKVVCVRASESRSKSGVYQRQIEVYSSDKGTWRERGEAFTADVNFDNGVYWNGAIHWISNWHDVNPLYFNPDHDQTVQVMPMPPISDGWDWASNYYFGESGGHLHSIELSGSGIQFNVYEMKRDYSEWFVKYEVDLSPIVAAYTVMNWDRDLVDPEGWHLFGASIFCMVRGREEEDDFLVLHIPGKVIRYNLVGRSFETLHEFECAEYARKKGCLAFHNGFQYIESLCYV